MCRYTYRLRITFTFRNLDLLFHFSFFRAGIFYWHVPLFLLHKAQNNPEMGWITTEVKWSIRLLFGQGCLFKPTVFSMYHSISPPRTEFYSCPFGYSQPYMQIWVDRENEDRKGNKVATMVPEARKRGQDGESKGEYGRTRKFTARWVYVSQRNGFLLIRIQVKTGVSFHHSECCADSYGWNSLQTWHQGVAQVTVCSFFPRPTACF